MTKVHELRKRIEEISEPVAGEVLAFLESRKEDGSVERMQRKDAVKRLRGAFKGRLGSSDEFAGRKRREILLEK
jgi:hypothetical protein